MSFIREFLLEAAEDMRVPNDPSQVSESPAAPIPMDDNNFATPPPAAAPGAPQIAPPPAMPTMDQTGAPTTQKDVLKSALVLAVTAELKAIISTCEKQFEKEDMTPETSGIYISNLLTSLASSAEKLKKVAGMSSEEAPAEETPLPEPVAEVPPPPPTEEGGMTEPMEAAGQPQESNESDMTEPGMEKLPPPEFTSPNEAI
jgi:hypothetical protein